MKNIHTYVFVILLVTNLFLSYGQGNTFPTNGNVGIGTTSVRFGEHLSSSTAKSLLRYEVVSGATNLSRTGARVWEQTLINQHGLNTLLNVRNSIAPKYWFQYGIKP